MADEPTLVGGLSAILLDKQVHVTFLNQGNAEGTVKAYEGGLLALEERSGDMIVFPASSTLHIRILP